MARGGTTVPASSKGDGTIPRSVELVRIACEGDRPPTDALRLARDDPRPVALLGAWAGGGAIVSSDPLVVTEDAPDPFSLLEHQPEVLGDRSSAGRPGVDRGPGVDGRPGVFGGWIGVLGYSLGYLREPTARGLRGRGPSLPDAGLLRPGTPPESTLGFYDHLVRFDERSAQWWFEALWSDEHDERLSSRLELWKARLSSSTSLGHGTFSCGLFALAGRAEGHLRAVATAIEHIRAGDVFQVNVCGHLEATFEGSALELFALGCARLSPRYGAYVAHGQGAVASFSPELFLKRQGRGLLTSPIKGTAARAGQLDVARPPSCAEDAGSTGLRGSTGLPGLASSEKDRAENLMIVDLMRNDLGRVCAYGTVRAPELWRTEGHPGVWHLVSDVVGELRDRLGDAALLRATFPPGSVTGAPKVRAMQLISELEVAPREAYTGAIGIASPVSGLELNVAIRTFEVSHRRVSLGVGGGVVADSDPSAELEECRVKARPLLEAVGGGLAPSAFVGDGPAGPAGQARPAGSARQARPARPAGPATPNPARGVFETLLVENSRPVLLEAHLGRLGGSLAALYGARLAPRVGAEVIELAAACRGRHRLRVESWPVGRAPERIETKVSAAPEPSERARSSSLVLVTVELPCGFGEHKWRDRDTVESLRAGSGLAPDELALFVDGDQVLETERANIFAVVEAGLVTPGLDGRILPGTTRATVIAIARSIGVAVVERELTVAECRAAEEVFVTSSVRLVVPALMGPPRRGAVRSDEPGVTRTPRAPGPRGPRGHLVPPGQPGPVARPGRLGPVGSRLAEHLVTELGLDRRLMIGDEHGAR